MYLYENKGNSIDIYSLESKKDTLKEYRLDKMKGIPREEQYLYSSEYFAIKNEPVKPILFDDEADTKVFSDELLKNRHWELKQYANAKKNISIREFIKSLGNRKRDISSIEETIKGYYNGEYSTSPVVQIEHLKELKYLLLTSQEYECNVNEHGGSFNFCQLIVDGIIPIPKSLYLLQLIEQEKFSLLQGEDIKEQLELFNLKQVDTIDSLEIKRFDSYGITNNAYTKTYNKCKNDSLILKLLK